ncbi:molybdenum cofactor guanylyltransferase [Aeromicrobium sp. CTD01-1L150]|uniref:molybdenum cofactor guanylyltransferase n=1 Tax=Aeromicrobium sp. CTD01-1L150 TaxID=3341830 RepID=UPI0035C1F2EA
MTATPHDAVILAGGRAKRFGDDKVLAEVEGSTLLATAVEAVSQARHVAVVGPRRDTLLPRPVRWCREEPPFGGPVVALAAGLAALPDDDADVLLLAADLPRAADLVAALQTTTPSDARVIVDADGQAQWTSSLVRRPALRDALRAIGEAHGASLRHLFSHLEWEPAPAPTGATWDVDTPDDLRRP